MANFKVAHSNLICLDRACEAYFGADFSTAQKLVKISEGGYTEDPADNGNWTSGKRGIGKLVGTNMGISAGTLGTYLGREATKAEMKALPYSTALKIYKKNFWDKIGGDSIKSQSVANTIYDAYVNQTGWTYVMLNDTLRNFGKEETSTRKVPIKSDTVRSINEVNASKFFNEFNKQRKRRYIEQSKKGANIKFLGGWMNRLANVTFDDVTEYAKRNMVALTLSLVAIAGLVYVGFKYRDKITKAIF